METVVSQLGKGQTVENPYNGILFRNKRNYWYTQTMNECHYAKWKKPYSKDHMLYDFMHIISCKGKWGNVNCSMVSRDGGGWRRADNKGTWEIGARGGWGLGGQVLDYAYIDFLKYIFSAKNENRVWIKRTPILNMYSKHNCFYPKDWCLFG